MFFGMTSLVGITAIAPAVLANPAQLATHSSAQQVSNHLKDQDDSTPKQGIPGRRVSGGTRNSQIFKLDQTQSRPNFYLKKV